MIKKTRFDKKEFIQSVETNVKTMYRKRLDEANKQEVFQAVSNTVEDMMMDQWIHIIARSMAILFW